MELFTLKYDFGEKNKEVQDFIKILGKNSMTFLSSLIEEKKISSKDYRNENLATRYFVRYVEEYLYYYYLFNKDDFSNIFSGVSKLCAIAPIDNNLRGLYGITIPVSTGFTIQINPLMTRGEFLNSAERSRLYVAHELGHVINAMWMKKVAEKFSVKTSSLKFSQDAQKIMYDGFSMLDEAITQDRAEDIAYFFAKKKDLLLLVMWMVVECIMEKVTGVTLIFIQSFRSQLLYLQGHLEELEKLMMNLRH